MKEEARKLIVDIWNKNTQWHGCVSIPVEELDRNERLLIRTLPFEGTIRRPLRLRFYQPKADHIWNFYIVDDNWEKGVEK